MSNSFYLIPFVGNSVCTECEKDSVWKVLLKLVDLIRVVRREGLLYLEDIADTEDDIFFRSCLRYIVEAAPTPRRLREYVSIWFVTADVSAVRRLEMAVIADGLEQMILQRTPSAALRRLGAWLGAEFADRVEEKRAEMNLVSHKERTESVEPEFDQLLTLSDKRLRAVLERLDDVEVALALIGASDSMAVRFKAVITSERWERIEKIDVSYPRASDVCAAQRQLLERI